VVFLAYSLANEVRQLIEFVKEWWHVIVDVLFGSFWMGRLTWLRGSTDGTLRQ